MHPSPGEHYSFQLVDRSNFFFFLHDPDLGHPWPLISTWFSVDFAVVAPDSDAFFSRLGKALQEMGTFHHPAVLARTLAIYYGSLYTGFFSPTFFTIPPLEL